MVRRLQAELVDELPPEHPEAIRTRRDLRRINTLMGHVGILGRALMSVRQGGISRSHSPVQPADKKAGPGDAHWLAFALPLAPALSPGERERLCFDQETAQSRRLNSAAGSIERPLRITELGAGDGEMLLRVAQRLGDKWNGVDVTFVDLQDLLRDETKAAFASRGWRVRCVKSDVLEWMSDTAGEQSHVIIANLFLHHFSDPQLSNLFSLAAKKADALIALEPRRGGWPLFCARSLPLIGFSPVTCHDAPISVQAGFMGRELSALWPQNGRWELTERRAGLFSHLFIARRKD